jgi:hypothetical protein
VTPARPARLVLTLVGGALMIASAFLDWLSGGPQGTGVPFQFLWSPAPRPSPGFFSSLGFVAIVLAVLAIVGLFLKTGVLTSLAGGLAIVVFVLSLTTLYRVETGPYSLGIGDVAVGAWLLFVGGVLAMVGGFTSTRRMAKPAQRVPSA